jgi:hypothetical protein
MSIRKISLELTDYTRAATRKEIWNLAIILLEKAQAAGCSVSSCGDEMKISRDQNWLR